MKLKNVPVLVYGLGKTGMETIKFLQKRKANVFIFDDTSFLKIPNTQWLNEQCDLSFLKFVVVSPGIGETKFLNKLKLFKIPVYSEFKFACQFLKTKLIAITGTNGKTTTVSLLGKILNDAGKKAVVCGNIGNPLISCIGRQKEYKFIVCEVSSFQLENLGDVNSYISVLLNIKPDHLERHKTFENYQELKFSIFKKQKKRSFAIVNKNLKNKYCLHGFQNNAITFSAYEQADAYMYGDNLVYKDVSIDTKKLNLFGKKNFENILTCMIVAKICKIKPAVIVESITSFNGLDHRIQFVKEIGGVKYFDDSKATNPDSTNCALEVFDKNVILLLGGYDKGLDYTSIFVSNKNIKALIAFGQAKDAIALCAQKNNIDKIVKCNKLKDAILKSNEIGQSGDIVLLSPACSSFDEFENFEKRGEYFADFVNGL